MDLAAAGITQSAVTEVGVRSAATREGSVCTKFPGKEHCIVNGKGGQTLKLHKPIDAGQFGCIFNVYEHRAAVKLTVEYDKEEHELLKAITRHSASPYLSKLFPGFEEVTQCCGTPCIVMMIISGGSMGRIMRDRGINSVDTLAHANAGCITQPWLQHVMLQILVAFRDCQLANLYNTDQHLRNIMVDSSLKVIFIDWGMAKQGTHTLPLAPFKTDKPGRQPQSFWTFAYLTVAPLRGQFEALVGRMMRSIQLQLTAEQVFLLEAFATPEAPTSHAPGRFFAGAPHSTIQILEEQAQLYQTSKLRVPAFPEEVLQTYFSAPPAPPPDLAKPLVPAVAPRRASNAGIASTQSASTQSGSLSAPYASHSQPPRLYHMHPQCTFECGFGFFDSLKAIPRLGGNLPQDRCLRCWWQSSNMGCQAEPGAPTVKVLGVEGAWQRCCSDLSCSHG